MKNVVSFDSYKKKLQPIPESNKKLPDFFYECMDFFEKQEYMINANRDDEEQIWKSN